MKKFYTMLAKFRYWISYGFLFVYRHDVRCVERDVYSHQSAIAQEENKRSYYKWGQGIDDMRGEKRDVINSRECAGDSVDEGWPRGGWRKVKVDGDEWRFLEDEKNFVVRII